MKKRFPVKRQLQLIMRISILQIVLALSVVSTSIAFDVHAQEALTRKVSMQVQQKQVKYVLQQLGQQAGIRFVFSSRLIQSDRKVSLQITDQPVATVLDKLLKPLGLSYEVSGENIVIQPSETVSSASPAPEQTQTEAAADLTITGTVTDEKGEILPGVSIVVKGTSRGVTTDNQGKYRISVPDTKAVLVFSFVGYEKQEVSVGARVIITVNLKVDDKTLNEVVVVGYGTVRKSDLTGAVSKLKTEGNEDKPITSIDQLIQGRVSGVQITQNSGAPGSGMTFMIRGAASVTGSNQPLIILDGFPVETGQNALGATTGSDGWSSSAPPANPLASINPNDIESIEILKDASSTAIYGSRGANGVVIITTKKGKLKKDQITYTFRRDVSRLPRQIAMLNTEDFIKYANEARLNSGLDSAFRAPAIASTLPFDNNWQALIYQEAVSTEHQLSASGGDERTKYLVSANYANQIGIVKNSSFTRGAFRANVERQISSKFKLSTNFSASLNVNKSAQQNNNNGNPQGAVVNGALTFRPFVAPFADADESEPNTAAAGNPLTVIQLALNHARSQVYLANLRGDYKINKYLTFTVNGGANATLSERDAFLPSGTFQGDQQNGVAYHGENKNINYLIENTLSYNKSFGKKHRLNAVGGYAWQEWTAKSFGVQASNFSTQTLSFYNFGLANSSVVPSNSYQKWGLSSFIGRANYVFDNRFLATLTGRADGATRLAPGNKWAFFPSAALGWNLHNESFLKNNKLINELKLRASYGVSGNQSIGIGSDLDRIFTQRVPIGTTIVTGLVPGALGNKNLGWETTTQWNIGVDVALLKNRLKFGVEAYIKTTDDLLINLALPTSTGYNNYATNFGKVSNKGIELDFSAAILDRELTWNMSGNYSRNINNVENLGGGVQLFGPNYFGGVNAINQPISTALAGFPIGAFFGYVHDGVYQTAEEITKGPRPLGTPRAGDIKFKDVNGDGAITTADRTIIGNPYPDFVFGWTNDFSYKNFNLNVFIMGNIGQNIANLNRFQIDNMNYLGFNNIRREAYENRWTGEGTSNYYPAPRGIQTASFQNLSSFLIEDGSFVRLKNVSLAYNFQTVKLKWLRNAKVFVSATNLLTFTNYKGYDPEVSANANSALTPGIDNGTIPQYRTYSTGVTIGF
ncbi:TonB-dependent receptor [Spirosoma sp. 209]|uniref:TonB-dependent receptor n=1 Tax=Spirosoma sp. 209 TaxID=1955701 RepID=UPI00098D1413|nr:TonB-dependent receptor [Spirosoma sp. 209]